MRKSVMLSYIHIRTIIGLGAVFAMAFAILIALDVMAGGAF